MLTVFRHGEFGLEREEWAEGGELGDDLLWLDLHDPTPGQRRAVEDALGIRLPSRDEMSEIEVSSRFVRDGDALYLTASVVTQAETPSPMLTPVTFVLHRTEMVTLRFADPLPIRTFPALVERETWMRETGETMLLGLLDAITARMADLLERIGTEIDRIRGLVFENGGGALGQSRRLEEAMQRIGRGGDLLSKSQESLLSIARLMTFLQATQPKSAAKGAKNRLKALARDIAQLNDHATALSQRVNFLLDATLGVINIQQNGIIKIFSVVSVVLMPPTLVASIYGMNFKHMPELDWLGGYPWALILMALSALVPFLYFKRKGWL